MLVLAHLIGDSGCARLTAKLYYQPEPSGHVTVTYANIIVRNNTTDTHTHNELCAHWLRHHPHESSPIPVRLLLRKYCFERKAFIADEMKLTTDAEIRDMLHDAPHVTGFEPQRK
jgi:uncharacterized protein YllA (UPF0747 family)